MKDLFYRCLASLARRFGNWIFLLIAWHVATGYFLFFPRRVAVSVRFYRRLFPERGRRHALRCAWRQYHHFVHVFLERSSVGGNMVNPPAKPLATIEIR